MEITWKNGFEIFLMIKYDIPKDHHCLLHAVMMAFFNPYITEQFNGVHISKLQIITNLRYELSEKLAQPVKGVSGPNHYDILNNGNTSKFSLSVPEFKLHNMMNKLKSNEHIGYGYFEFINNQLNKDIYILDAKTQDLYQTDEYKYSIKGRNSIVLLYIENKEDEHLNHYDLIGINGVTHFKPNNPFILFLKSKIRFT